MSFSGIEVIVCHAKGMFFCFKGKHVHMSGCHHIDMFHTHLTLISRSFLHHEKSFLCILDGLGCVTKCLCVITVKSYHVYICFIDLTLSHFSEQPNLIQLPETVHFAYATIKLPPLPVETPQCVETPISLAC